VRRPGRERLPGGIDSAAMDNDLVKRLAWSGLLAGLGALASIATQRVASAIWLRVYGEDPPE
jgi:hypothetical protein